MSDLDLNLGKGIMRGLCAECRKHLEKVISQRDIKRVYCRPNGFKKLVDKISKNTCKTCEEMIWRKGAETSYKK